MTPKSKIDILKNKLKAAQNSYEDAKRKREEVTSSMEALDQKIELIDKTIKETKSIMMNNHFNKIKNKENNKRLIRIILTEWSIAIVLTTLIKFLAFKQLSIPVIGIFISGLTIAVSNIVEQKIKNLYKKTKKIKPKDMEVLEKEKKQLIEKRISKGAEYKKVREDEVLKEKIYKELKIIIDSQIESIFNNQDREFKQKEIETKDIYYKIKIDCNFDGESIENKKQILDIELKKYLALKITETYYNTIKPEELMFLTTEELVRMILNESPKHKHKEILTNIIHAIINFSGYLQGYSIVWLEEDNENLIKEPTITFDESGNWSKFKTHNKTDYYHAFKVVYETFSNKVLNNKSKTHKKYQN